MAYQTSTVNRAAAADGAPGAASGGAPEVAEPAAGRLRVVFLLRVADGAQERFLAAYQQIRHQVASVAGHLVDQLCQSTTDPAEWMITSEWESPEHFDAWERGAGHRELAGPLVACTTQRRSLRYLVRYQTHGAAAVPDRVPGGTPERTSNAASDRVSDRAPEADPDGALDGGRTA